VDAQSIVTIITSSIAAITTVVTVIVSSRLQKANEKNIKLRESLNKKKMAFYQEILAFLDDMIDGKYEESDTDQLKEFIQGKFKEAAYYASPEVIKSLGDLMQHYYTNKDLDIHVLRGRKLFAELTVQIRKDIGHDTRFHRRETWLDVLRFSIKDIHQYVPKNKAKDRGKKSQPDMVLGKKRIK
jgi:hypothetical protein